MKSPDAPPHDCPLCPRLVAFRAENRKKFPDYFNGPVPNFGPLEARLLIAGLAPGLHGANATGRPFTGDWAGDLLYATLKKHGLAKGEYDERPDDGLQLIDCRIANSVHCVPPQNKPEPSEINTCRRFLQSELDVLPRVKVILALGKIAHDSVLRTLGVKIAAHPFKHGVAYEIGKFTLISSYHCSR
ncbi:MAG TPA: uracil-DNA glycosylase, partial [Burkholderiales bacterium]|nr:uracil-DNA glycosylase [Burkholderiales bacterium]